MFFLFVQFASRTCPGWGLVSSADDPGAGPIIVLAAIWYRGAPGRVWKSEASVVKAWRAANDKEVVSMATASGLASQLHIDSSGRGLFTWDQGGVARQ